MNAFNSLNNSLTAVATNDRWTAIPVSAGADPAGWAALRASPADPVSLSPVVLRGSVRQTSGDPTFYFDQPKHTNQEPDVRPATDSIKGKLDSLSEMGEMESQRLQMAMDRLSKFMQTLSNLLKKSADTDSGIVGNIK